MQVRRTFKYRLYPSKHQQKTIDNQLELCRQLYNYLLEVKIETYKQSGKALTNFDLDKCILYFNNTNPEFKLVNAQVKQNISNRINKAFNNMFKRIRRGEEKVGFPRFKGRGRYKSICYPQYIIPPKGNKLYVSKIGDINIKLHRRIKGKIKTMTISKTSTNKYYVTFSCIMDNSNQKIKTIKKESVGLDVGLNHFLTTSNGQQIINPKFYREAESKLAKLQRRKSKKKLRSKNYQKARLKVALVHEKIKNQRLDFTHKLSHYFVTNYSHIGIEDLNIKGMVQNHHLSKSILDSGWGMFYTQLQYKAEYADSEVTQVNRFYPSTKTCSKCSKINNMPLHKRTYTCECGNVMDRDHNAAINIDKESLKLKQIPQEMWNFKPVKDEKLFSSMNQETLI